MLKPQNRIEEIAIKHDIALKKLILYSLARARLLLRLGLLQDCRRFVTSYVYTVSTGCLMYCYQWNWN